MIWDVQSCHIHAINKETWLQFLITPATAM
jgi:hypothetical protein